MNRWRLRVLFGVIVICLVAAPAWASPIVWDWSPATTGATVTSDYWSNNFNGQHFADMVLFGSGMSVDGIDIYMSPNYPSLSQTVKITIWADAAGQPGAVAAQYSSLVSIIDTSGAAGDNVRVHADFTPFLMGANTPYWIGMAGDGTTMTQTGLSGVNEGDSRMAQFNDGDSFSYFTGTSVGDMAFRLNGTPTQTVPDPGSSLLLLLLGLAGLRACRKRQ